MKTLRRFWFNVKKRVYRVAPSVLTGLNSTSDWLKAIDYKYVRGSPGVNRGAFYITLAQCLAFIPGRVARKVLRECSIIFIDNTGGFYIPKDWVKDRHLIVVVGDGEDGWNMYRIMHEIAHFELKHTMTPDEEIRSRQEEEVDELLKKWGATITTTKEVEDD